MWAFLVVLIFLFCFVLFFRLPSLYLPSPTNEYPKKTWVVATSFFHPPDRPPALLTVLLFSPERFTCIPMVICVVGNNNLLGSLPGEIYLLSNLKVLKLNNNRLYDTIPTKELSMLSKLQILLVGAYTMQLCVCVGMLFRIEMLFFSNSLSLPPKTLSLSLTLPSLSRCSHTRIWIFTLYKGDNDMTGDLSDSFCSMDDIISNDFPNLVELQADCDIEQAIPSSSSSVAANDTTATTTRETTTAPTTTSEVTCTCCTECLV